MAEVNEVYYLSEAEMSALAGIQKSKDIWHWRNRSVSVILAVIIKGIKAAGAAYSVTREAVVQHWPGCIGSNN